MLLGVVEALARLPFALLQQVGLVVVWIPGVAVVEEWLLVVLALFQMVVGAALEGNLALAGQLIHLHFVAVLLALVVVQAAAGKQGQRPMVVVVVREAVA